MTEDYYWVLGIEQGASRTQIQIAYQRRIRELESGSHKETPLLDVQEAYSVLGAPSRRRAYDLSPHKVPIQPQDAPSRMAPAEPLIPRKATGGVIDASVTHSFRTARPSFDEIHDRLWSNFKDVTQPKAETIESLTLEIPLSPHQALTGGRARVLVPTRTECMTCGGRGGIGPFACVRGLYEFLCHPSWVRYLLAGSVMRPS